MPYHIYFGFLAYMLAVLAALMGLAEKASFHMYVAQVAQTTVWSYCNCVFRVFSSKNISELPHEAILVNSIGALIILFAALIGFLVSTAEYKRQPLPEDEMLLAGVDD